MRRLLPYPLLWIAMLVLWLLLSGSVAIGQVLLGAVVATLACWAMRRLEPTKPRIRHPWRIVEVLGILVLDILRSNLAVFLLVLRPGPQRHQPKFLVIPLELREPNALAILACIVSATPGSAWLDYDVAAGAVTIHVLDVPDEAAWIASFKLHYEKRLLEIFQ
jgi:multicomponent K+:H+ antiporter subunit E